MTCHFLDLGSASEWLKQISLAPRPIKISTLVPKNSFREEINVGCFLRLVFKIVQSWCFKVVFDILFFLFACCVTEASTTQPESSSEEEEERPSSRGIASDSSDSEDENGTFFALYIQRGIGEEILHPARS